MSAAYRAALAALARIRAQLAADLAPADRVALLEEFDAVLATLGRAEHRADTVAMAERVQRLDQQLKDREPAERNAIVMQRLGVSRTRLYELRAVRLSPDGSEV